MRVCACVCVREGFVIFLTVCFCPQPSLPVLYTLSSQATHEAVHLLCRMLVFDPVSPSCSHPQLIEP